MASTCRQLTAPTYNYNWPRKLHGARVPPTVCRYASDMETEFRVAGIYDFCPSQAWCQRRASRKNGSGELQLDAIYEEWQATRVSSTWGSKARIGLQACTLSTTQWQSLHCRSKFTCKCGAFSLNRFSFFYRFYRLFTGTTCTPTLCRAAFIHYLLTLCLTSLVQNFSWYAPKWYIIS